MPLLTSGSSERSSETGGKRDVQSQRERERERESASARAKEPSFEKKTMEKKKIQETSR